MRKDLYAANCARGKGLAFLKVGFVGAGKVGASLGAYMARRGVPLAGYYSQSPASAQAAASRTGTQAFGALAPLLESCDCLFLTVPDDALPGVWAQVKRLPLAGKLVCHCSGLRPSAVLEGIEALGAGGYAVHPMIAVPGRDAAEAFEAACFTVEGSTAHMGAMAALMAALGNRWQVIAADQKPRYHAACVTVSNLVNGLCRVGEDLLLQCGLDADFAQEAWQGLFLHQAQNICRAGIGPSLTGPVERGDAQTVRTHMENLHPPAVDIYRLLSGVLVDIAEAKHPDRDYSQIKKELLS